MTHCAYKFRIYPNKEQEIVLKKTIGCCRYIYNWGLEKRRNSWTDDSKSYSYEKTCEDLTKLKKEIDWLKEASSACLQQSLKNLDASFTNFFKKRAKYPKLKKRKNGGSSRYQSNGFRLIKKVFYLAKIKTPIKVNWSRELPSKPSFCTVSQNPSGQWFVSFVCEEKIKPLRKKNKKIGIDLGIESFATLSDGTKIKQPDSIRKMRRKLARSHRALSRKKKGSNNRNKARIRLARNHQKVANVRNDFQQKLSTKIIRENQTIVIEDLTVSSMMKKGNRKLARLISEQGWYSFRRMLRYKAKWRGRELIVVDKFFPSSKTCSCCGKRAELTLKDRVWSCACGATHDRDVNAAKNILAVGTTVSACGTGVRLSSNRKRSVVKQETSLLATM